MSYLLVKWIHIVSSTILFGTGIGSAFYMVRANRRGRVEEIHFAARTVVVADWLFTAPAMVVQLITGIGLVHLLGHDFAAFWISAAMALYVFAACCWLPVVWIQIAMRNMAIAALEKAEPLPQRYWRLERIWTLLGWCAFAAFIAIFYLMVFKPAGWLG